MNRHSERKMTPRESAAVTAVSNALLAAMESSGLDTHSLREWMDIQPTQGRTLERVSLRQFAACFFWSIEAGLALGKSDAPVTKSGPSRHRMLASVIAHSSTLREAMTFYEDYSGPHATHFYNLMIRPQGDHLYCGYHRSHPTPPLTPPVLELFDVIHLYWWKHMLSWWIDSQLPISEISVAGNVPDCLDAFSALLDAPLVTGSEYNTISFPAVFGDFAIAHGFRDVDTFMREPISWLAGLESSVRSTTADQVLGLLGEHLDGPRPTLYEVAQSLGCSIATVRRRLAAEGTGYRTLKEQSLHRAARRLLASTDLTNAEIAERLGYNGTAPFYSAFRKWEGMTPSQYRSLARASETGPA